MRVDKEGNQITLEQDILEIWDLHGWGIIEERVSGNTWEITAKAKKSSKPLLNNDFKKVCPKCKKQTLSQISKGEAWGCSNLNCSYIGKPISKS